jgi:hypothetical protein
LMQLASSKDNQPCWVWVKAAVGHAPTHAASTQDRQTTGQSHPATSSFRTNNLDRDGSNPAP